MGVIGVAGRALIGGIVGGVVKHNIGHPEFGLLRVCKLGDGADHDPVGDVAVHIVVGAKALAQLCFVCGHAELQMIHVGDNGGLGDIRPGVVHIEQHPRTDQRGDKKENQKNANRFQHRRTPFLNFGTGPIQDYRSGSFCRIFLGFVRSSRSGSKDGNRRSRASIRGRRSGLRRR